MKRSRENVHRNVIITEDIVNSYINDTFIEKENNIYLISDSNSYIMIKNMNNSMTNCANNYKLKDGHSECGSVSTITKEKFNEYILSNKCKKIEISISDHDISDSVSS